MAKPKVKYRHLPPRMTVRIRTLKNGEEKVRYYYEHPRDKNGKRIATPLGNDLAEAKIKWAKIEGQPVPTDLTTVAGIYEQYLKWAENLQESGLSLRTIRDRKAYWEKLKGAYGHVKINSVKPDHILPYFHKRSSKISAKKEIKFLSVMFTWARARGLMRIENPVTGLTRQMKVKETREIYVSDSDLDLVYRNASDVIRDAMDIAYLTGQRPSDVRKMRWDHIKDGRLEIQQDKTGKKMKIEIIGELEQVIERIRRRGVLGMTILTDPKGQPLNQFGHYRNQFNKARDAAEAEAKKLGVPFTRFQFRDLRAKAATDLDDDLHAKNLLGHRSVNTTTAYLRSRESKSVSPVMAKFSVSQSKKKKRSK